MGELRHWLAIGFVAATAQSPQPTDVRVPLPAGVTRAVCRVESDGRLLASIEGQSALTFSCPARTEQVSCDLEGGEPLDLPLSSICRSRTMPLIRASRRVVVNDARSDLVGQWLHVEENGDLTSRATRQLGSDPVAALEVAADSAEIVRFLRKGAAPVSVDATTLLSVSEWHLPAPVLGGELLVRSANSPIVPTDFQLVRPGLDVTYKAQPGSLSIVGVPAGEYELVPVYAGGVRGLRQRVRIEGGRSTWAFVPKETVGGLALGLESLCAATGRVRLVQLKQRTVTLPDGSRSVTTMSADFLRVEPVLECDLRIAGIPPGSYDVVVEDHAEKLLRRRRVQVEANQFTNSAVGAVSLVSGAVTLNGRPWPDAIVEFRGINDGRPSAAPKTDGQGQYVAELEKPGSYVVAVLAKGFPVPGQRLTVDVPRGDKSLDLKLVGGTLTVKLSYVDVGGGRRIMFNLDELGPQKDGRAGFAQSLREDDPDLANGALTFKGLAFDKYAIRASEWPAKKGMPTRVSERVQFEISQTKPDAVVSLSLKENHGALVLADVQGQPVTGANVYGLGVSATETDPGDYSMDGVASGLELQVRASNYVPICKIAPDQPLISSVLEAGRTVEVRFPGRPSSLTSPDGLVLWAGTDCAVGLSSFPFIKLPSGEGGVPRFALSHFPSTDQLTFAESRPITQTRPVVVINGVATIQIR